MPPRPIVLLAACLVPLPGQPARSQSPAAQGKQSPPEKRAIRTDRYGDPLPPGAVARLGTERLALHGGIGLSFAFSPDGRLLAAHNGSVDLRVWEVATGKEVLRLKHPRSRGGAGPGETLLTFSPDGKALALASQDLRAQTGAVRVWGVDTGKELHQFTGFRGRVGHLACTPDGRSLLAGGSEGSVLCWDLARGGPPRTIGDFPAVAFLAVSRDGTALIAGTVDRQDWRKRTFVRWDLATGKEVGRHSLTTPGRWACALSPEGEVFAVPDADGKSIALLDPLTGRECGRAQGSDYPAFVSFSADGSAMTCSSKDGVARVWDTATGKPRARFKALSTGISWTALSPDGKLLALAGRADHAVYVWDVAAGRELHSFVGHRSGPLAVAFIGKGREVATVCSVQPGYYVKWADCSFRRWDAATGAQRAVTSFNSGHGACGAAFSADGRRLATVSNDGTLRLWDVEAGRQLRTWKVPTGEMTATSIDPKGTKTVLKTPILAVTQPAFTPDGLTLLAGGAKVYRWEVATGKELPSFEAPGTARRRSSCWCAPSPDGRTLLVWGGGRDAKAVLMDATTGQVLRPLGDTPLPMRRPCFSPDGRTVAFQKDSFVSLWEVASGRSRGRLVGPAAVRALAFSSDGRLLATWGGMDASVSLWDLTAGAVVGSLRVGIGGVNSLAFSPDGSRLAVAGYSPAALVYDVAALCDETGRKTVVKAAEPTAEDLEGLWADLGGADGARAYRAVRRLGAAGARGAAFLKKRLQGGAVGPDERRIALLIADLDHDDFAAREKASAELETIGPRAEAALRRALGGKASPEARKRITRLLERLGPPQGPPPPPELVRLRGIEALEANGTPEARKALEELAAGPADSALAREAKVSLERLASRPAVTR